MGQRFSPPISEPDTPRVWILHPSLYPPRGEHQFVKKRSYFWPQVSMSLPTTLNTIRVQPSTPRSRCARRDDFPSTIVLSLSLPRKKGAEMQALRAHVAFKPSRPPSPSFSHSLLSLSLSHTHTLPLSHTRGSGRAVDAGPSSTDGARAWTRARGVVHVHHAVGLAGRQRGCSANTLTGEHLVLPGSTGSTRAPPGINLRTSIRHGRYPALSQTICARQYGEQRENLH